MAAAHILTLTTRRRAVMTSRVEDVGMLVPTTARSEAVRPRHECSHGRLTGVFTRRMIRAVRAGNPRCAGGRAELC